jgi:hypothetical protein
MSEIFDTVLLLALPASGKSEVRTYLDQLDRAECARDFHIGPTVQLGDLPHIHMMRQIDEALAAVDKEPIFFQTPTRPFIEGRDWGTLVQLVNEDYADLITKRVAQPDSAASHLLDRFDAARRKVGATAALSQLDADTRRHVCASIEEDARDLLAAKHENQPDTLNGKTVVIELARGGPQGAKMPLEPPFGYGYSLAQLNPEILERAVILYIWVTPEESRQKNEARANPDDPGSILHTVLPAEVMFNDYGCDDIEYLMHSSGQPNTILVSAYGKRFHLPMARFDNRHDKTSFVRGDAKKWQAKQVEALHMALQETLERLYRQTAGEVS